MKKIKNLQFSSKSNHLYYLSLDYNNKAVIFKVDLNNQDLISEAASKKFPSEAGKSCSKIYFEKYQKLRLEKNSQEYLALQYSSQKILVLKEEEDIEQSNTLGVKGVIKLTKGSRISDFACFAYQKLLCISNDGFICPFLFNNSEFKRLKSPKLALNGKETLSEIRNCDRQRYFCVMSKIKKKQSTIPYNIYLFFMDHEFEVSFLSYLPLNKFALEKRIFTDFHLFYKETQKKTLMLLIASNSMVHGYVKGEEGKFKEIGNFNFHPVDSRIFGEVCPLEEDDSKFEIACLEGNWVSFFKLKFNLNNN